jgi:hypothetical protein
MQQRHVTAPEPAVTTPTRGAQDSAMRKADPGTSASQPPKPAWPRFAPTPNNAAQTPTGGRTAHVGSARHGGDQPNLPETD